MKRYLTTLVCALSLMAGAATPRADAQLFGRGPYREPVLDRTQSDLSRAMEHAYKRDRINNAQRHLVEFQAERASGRFGGKQFRRAVNSLTDVVRGNGIDPRDRDILARDLDEMRQFGARNGY